MTAEQRHGGRNSWRSHLDPQAVGKEQTGKDINHTSTRSHHLMLPKQFYQQGTKHPTLRAYGGHSHSNHHSRLLTIEDQLQPWVCTCECFVWTDSMPESGYVFSVFYQISMCILLTLYAWNFFFLKVKEKKHLKYEIYFQFLEREGPQTKGASRPETSRMALPEKEVILTF